MDTIAVWLAVALGLGIIEVITGTFVCLIFAISALFGAVCSLFLSNLASVVISACIAVLCCFFVLRRNKRSKHNDAAYMLQNSDIGHTVRVEHWNGRTTRVSYRGAMWDARSSETGTPQEGLWTIASMDGSCLILTPKKED